MKKNNVGYKVKDSFVRKLLWYIFFFCFLRFYLKEKTLLTMKKMSEDDLKDYLANFFFYLYSHLIKKNKHYSQ